MDGCTQPRPTRGRQGVELGSPARFSLVFSPDEPKLCGLYAHPYTLGLLQSVPRADKKTGPLSPIGGAPPDMRRLPPGCTFHPRCPYMKPVCIEEEPLLTAAEPAQLSACHFKHEVRRDAEGRR